jgi:hypothetical protein
MARDMASAKHVRVFHERLLMTAPAAYELTRDGKLRIEFWR